MSGIYARRVVAPMQNVQLTWRAVRQLPRDTMGQLAATGAEFEAPVTERVTPCCPNPTWPQLGAVLRSRA